VHYCVELEQYRSSSYTVTTRLNILGMFVEE